MGSPKIIAKRGWAARGGIALARGSAGRGAPNGPRRGAARHSSGSGLRCFAKRAAKGAAAAALEAARRFSTVGAEAARVAAPTPALIQVGARGGDEANGCVESGEGVRDRRSESGQSESGRSESGPARPAKARPAKAEQAKASRAKARRTERARHARPSQAPQRRRRLAGAARGVFFEQMPGAGEGRRGAGRGRGNGGGEGKLGRRLNRACGAGGPDLRPAQPENQGAGRSAPLARDRIGRRGP